MRRQSTMPAITEQQENVNPNVPSDLRLPLTNPDPPLAPPSQGFVNWVSRSSNDPASIRIRPIPWTPAANTPSSMDTQGDDRAPMDLEDVEFSDEDVSDTEAASDDLKRVDMAKAFTLNFGMFRGIDLGTVAKTPKGRKYLRYLLSWDKLYSETKNPIKVVLMYHEKLKLRTQGTTPPPLSR